MIYPARPCHGVTEPATRAHMAEQLNQTLAGSELSLLMSLGFLFCCQKSDAKFDDIIVAKWVSFAVGLAGFVCQEATTPVRGF